MMGSMEDVEATDDLEKTWTMLIFTKRKRKIIESKCIRNVFNTSQCFCNAIN